ncbi:MAG: dihydrofolate reductase family protein [Pseudomonadota bacterium]
MRDLAVLIFQTLDGVMQAPAMPDEDRSGGFSAGGWAAEYWGPVMQQVQRVAMAEPYDIVFGRKTYQSFAEHWPKESDDNPVARVMNGATKHVLTNTLSKLEWSNAVAVTGEPAAAVSQLKQQPGPPLQVHGSWALIQALLPAGLIDEFRLWTFPVVVGSGKRLFAAGGVPEDLELQRSEAASNGVIMGIYRRRDAGRG